MQLSPRDFALLVILTIVWGINWPIMKIGVQNYPPLTFRTLSMYGGILAIYAVVRARGLPLAVPRDKWPELARLTLFNMVGWHVFAILGVKLLASGRAAILGYTMPVFAAVWGALLFRQAIGWRGVLGLLAALTGSGLLLGDELARMAGAPLGAVLMLVAASSWALGTHLLRRTSIVLPTLSIALWMTIFTTMVMTLAAVLFESGQWRAPDDREWGAIVYNSVMVFGVAHVVWFHLARILPPIASSLSVMLIPVLGVFSGAWMLGEQLGWQDYAAIVLTSISIASVLLPARNPARG